MIIPVFVYGTLRIGEWNHDWFKPCVEEEEADATTPGHLWFAYEGSYPVARFIPSETALIHGDVLWCDTEHPGYGHMVNMEVNAGYAQREIEVRLAGGNLIDATGFHYLRDPRPSLFIQGGDWRKEHKRYHAQIQRERAVRR